MLKQFCWMAWLQIKYRSNASFRLLGNLCAVINIAAAKASVENLRILSFKEIMSCKLMLISFTKAKQNRHLRWISNSNISVSRSVVSDSLRPHGLYPPRLLCPWNSPGKNTGVGCHSLLQGIFQTQGLNLGLLHCRQILCHLSHQGSRHQGSRGVLSKCIFS